MSLLALRVVHVILLVKGQKSCRKTEKHRKRLKKRSPHICEYMLMCVQKGILKETYYYPSRISLGAYMKVRKRWLIFPLKSLILFCFL